MVKGCGTNLAKILLIIFNVLFFLCGAALLGTGIWILVDKNISEKLDFLAALEGGGGNLLQYSAYLLLAVGGVIILISFFGCCGAATESTCMLGIYIFFLAIILIAQLVGGILAAVYKDDIMKKADQLYKDRIKQYYNTDGSVKTTVEYAEEFDKAAGIVQYEFKCCGFNGYKELKDVMTDTNAVPPKTCCLPNDATKDYDEKTYDAADLAICAGEFNQATTPVFDQLYGKGCKESVIDWMESNSTILIGVGIGLCAVELLGFLFAICLCCAIRKQD